jgi:hypothetical protein
MITEYETSSLLESIQDDPAQEKENEKSDFSAAEVAYEVAEYTGKTALITGVVLMSIYGIMQKHSSAPESLLFVGGAAGALGLILFGCTQAYLSYKSNNAPVAARETPSWCDKGHKAGGGIELVSLQEEDTTARP